MALSAPSRRKVDSASSDAPTLATVASSSTVAFTAVAGVVISLYYYFGVIRAIYWSQDAADLSPVSTTLPTRVSLYACLAGMFFLGLFPGWIVNVAAEAVKVLQ